MAVLVRIRFNGQNSIVEQRDWDRLLADLKNNCPDVVDEWRQCPASRQKRAFRETFGQDGDVFRRAGYGTINVGPLTGQAIRRFLVKFGQALFYKHCERILDGTVIAYHLSQLSKPVRDGLLTELIKSAPLLANPCRGGKSLSSQFEYRFNYSLDIGALISIVQFSPQMTFQLFVLEQSTLEALNVIDDLTNSTHFAGTRVQPAQSRSP